MRDHHGHQEKQGVGWWCAELGMETWAGRREAEEVDLWDGLADWFGRIEREATTQSCPHGPMTARLCSEAGPSPGGGHRLMARTEG